MYKLDPTLAAGPIFNFQYDGRLFFNTYHNEADMCLQNTQTLDLIVYIEIIRGRCTYPIVKTKRFTQNLKIERLLTL